MPSIIIRMQKGMKMEHGLDIAICGDIPNGSGLSSSASLEVLTGVILKDLFGFDVSMVDIALIGEAHTEIHALHYNPYAPLSD